MGFLWELLVLLVLLVGLLGLAGVLVFIGVCAVYFAALALLSDVSR